MEINPAAQPYPGIPKEIFLWGITTNKTISNHMDWLFCRWVYMDLFAVHSKFSKPAAMRQGKKPIQIKGFARAKAHNGILYPLFCYGVSAAMPLISPNVTRDTKVRLNHMVRREGLDVLVA